MKVEDLKISVENINKDITSELFLKIYDIYDPIAPDDKMLINCVIDACNDYSSWLETIGIKGKRDPFKAVNLKEKTNG